MSQHINTRMLHTMVSGITLGPCLGPQNQNLGSLCSCSLCEGRSTSLGKPWCSPASPRAPPLRRPAAPGARGADRFLDLLLMIEILHHLIYTYLYYTARIPTLRVYEVYIKSCRISTINSSNVAASIHWGWISRGVFRIRELLSWV